MHFYHFQTFCKYICMGGWESIVGAGKGGISDITALPPSPPPPFLTLATTNSRWPLLLLTTDQCWQLCRRGITPNCQRLGSSNRIFFLHFALHRNFHRLSLWNYLSFDGDFHNRSISWSDAKMIIDRCGWCLRCFVFDDYSDDDRWSNVLWFHEGGDGWREGHRGPK